MRRKLAANSATAILLASVLFTGPAIFSGCSEPKKPGAGSTAGSSPSLDAKSADERAAAAREAAKKYGTGP